MKGSRGRPLRPPGEGRTLPAVSELFVEPFGGIAGDMLLGALLDLGDPRVDLDGLQAVVECVLPGEVRLAAETVWRGGLSGTWLQVTTPESGTTPHRGLRDLLELLGTAGLSERARSRAAAMAGTTGIAAVEAAARATDQRPPYFMAAVTFACFESYDSFIIRLRELGRNATHVRMRLEDKSWRVTDIIR